MFKNIKKSYEPQTSKCSVLCTKQDKMFLKDMLILIIVNTDSLANYFK